MLQSKTLWIPASYNHITKGSYYFFLGWLGGDALTKEPNHTQLTSIKFIHDENMGGAQDSTSSHELKWPSYLISGDILSLIENSGSKLALCWQFSHHTLAWESIVIPYCLVHQLEMAQFAGQGQSLTKLSPPSFLHRNSPEDGLSLIASIHRISSTLGLPWSGRAPLYKTRLFNLIIAGLKMYSIWKFL